MRLLVLSDLHHEVWREHAPPPDISASRPDAVILAGDIDTGARAVAWAARVFAGLPVLYVHGNHEGYGHQLEQLQHELREACHAAGNVHLLDRGEHVIGKVRFLGATLWTDFKLFGEDARQAAMNAAASYMPDYKRISLASEGGRKLAPQDTAQLHAQHTAWLAEKLAQPFDGRSVVITHMAPSILSVARKYASDPCSAAFASRLDGLVEQADLWVHGHMHDTLDYRIGACRVVCNPCGYINRAGNPENPAFDPNLIVQLD